MATRELVRRREDLPSVFNDFFRPWDSLFDMNGGSLLNKLTLNPINIPAVNILENKDSYQISLAVPGMKKEDFNIDIEGNTLSISAEKNEESNGTDQRYTRKEFNYTSFCRSFSLPEGVNKEKIDANYEHGLLKISLPKTDEARKSAARQISVR